MRRKGAFCAVAGAVLGLLVAAAPAQAFRVIGSPAGWARWDAAERYVGGEERSLAGGLRYSIEHGDYGLLRDELYEEAMTRYRSVAASHRYSSTAWYDVEHKLTALRALRAERDRQFFGEPAGSAQDR